MSQRKTINVEDVFHYEFKDEGSGGFVIEFNNSKHKVRIHLKDHAIGFIGTKMHEHLKAREQELARLKTRLRGET